MTPRVALAASVLLGLGLVVNGQQPAPQPTPAGAGRSTNLGSDPNGNPLRLALKTGHVSNYDEAKVAPYTLPDPLVMADGTPVRDAKTWQTRRRPEILRLYETDFK